MPENYKSTYFTDVSDITVAYHSNDPTHKYGPSYTWNEADRPIFAEQGWHMATDHEWRAHYDFVKTNVLKINESGTSHWNTDNSTNETGFTVLGSAHIYGAPLKAENT